MNNGNGSGDPRIQQATRILVQCREPLEQLDAAIAKLQGQLTTANAAVASCQQEFESAGCAYADDDRQPNRARLFAARDNLAAAQAKIKPLEDKIARLAAQRQSLDAKVQDASVALSKISDDVRLETLEKEESVGRYKIAQLEEGIREWKKRVDAARNEKIALLRRLDDARWKRDKALALERARHNVSPEIITVRR
jgi:predicted  nucleic acid-binding Zn-ribbon protein